MHICVNLLIRRWIVFVMYQSITLRSNQCFFINLYVNKLFLYLIIELLKP